MTDKKVTKSKAKEDKKVSKVSDLAGQVKALRQELFTLKLDNVQKKLKNTTSLTLKRKELARLLTAMREVTLTHEENI
jgi:ribosomal protein L29